jgi:hypothetical protein
MLSGMARRPPLAIANAAMLLAFLGFAAVQWNDPDPLRWMGLYLVAAASCALHLAGVLPWMLAAAVGLVALVWAIAWMPGLVARPSLVQLFASYQMMSPAVEEVRELLGLLIVAGWMATLVAVRRRHAAGTGSAVGT